MAFRAIDCKWEGVRACNGCPSSFNVSQERGFTGEGSLVSCEFAGYVHISCDAILQLAIEFSGVT